MSQILSCAFAKIEIERVYNAKIRKSVHDGVCKQTHEVIEVRFEICSYISYENVKIRNFYSRSQLARQSVQSNQKLNEQVADVERIKKKLRIIGQVSPKKRLYDWGSQVELPSNKRPAMPKPKPQGSTYTKKHCTKCSRTNHDTSKCKLRNQD